jgi:transcriptional regulator
MPNPSFQIKLMISLTLTANPSNLPGKAVNSRPLAVGLGAGVFGKNCRSEKVRSRNRLVDELPGCVADDLNHLLRSLKHTEYNTVVEPARCRACGFEFSAEKLTKPSKCPECRSTWVLEPKIGVENKTEGGQPLSK